MIESLKKLVYTFYEYCAVTNYSRIYLVIGNLQ